MDAGFEGEKGTKRATSEKCDDDDLNILPPEVPMSDLGISSDSTRRLSRVLAETICDSGWSNRTSMGENSWKSVPQGSGNVLKAFFVWITMKRKDTVRLPVLSQFMSL